MQAADYKENMGDKTINFDTWISFERAWKLPTLLMHHQKEKQPNGYRMEITMIRVNFLLSHQAASTIHCLGKLTRQATR